MSSVFNDYFRCPSEFGRFGITGELSSPEGYFLFRDAICYGRQSGTGYSENATARMPDVSEKVEISGDQVRLPFDLSEVIGNLREERYHQNSTSALSKVTRATASRGIYYFLRPILPVSVRKHLQRISLSGWNKIPFPRWPVDVSVETLMQNAMALELKSGRVDRIPFIWFWPDAAAGCTIITHDVEGPAGQAFCGQLMDIDEAFGFKSAFQIVPEERYEASQTLFADFRRRGFEVNVHDLNHDGYLYKDRQQFDRRAAKINQYAREFQSRGFRSGAMYREQEWYDAFEVSYDMSVPNVAHLEPQRGGCCTVMPYFVGKILELPLTTMQDYSLFHIFGDYSITQWKKQIDLILEKNGLVSILTHPDYLIDQRARSVYEELLAHVRQLRDEGTLWAALPGDVDRWWRQRHCMTLVQDGGRWRVQGTGSDRAKVAYATLQDGRLVYTLEPTA